MTEIKKVVIIILDGVGIGEMPDADKFGDKGSHTLGNIAKAVGGLNLPNLQKLGLGNIENLEGVKPAEKPQANYGKMAEVSPGKDSTSGHWEIGGLQLDYDFPYYPQGFPSDIIKEFTDEIRRGILGNKTASGTEILKELGEEHVKTGKPIVYTSADSVFQIAAHENVISREKLYEICEIARKILRDEHAVARVIARPFIGDNAENFTRTKGRKDYSLKPSGKTMLKLLQEMGIKTIGIGKIDDLYAGEGLDVKLHTKVNSEGVAATIEQISFLKEGLVMTNLVDFDMLWGHRNNVEGFYNELQEFDKALPEIMQSLDEDTILILTADHGNDPTTPGTDHSREHVPLLVYGKGIKHGINLGLRNSFADVGRTITDIFNCKLTRDGKSFFPILKKY